MVTIPTENNILVDMFLMILLNNYDIYANEAFWIDNKFSFIHFGIV